jgi:hypothetical protein
MKEGIKEGIKETMKKRRKEGRKEGRKGGREEGRKGGRNETGLDKGRTKLSAALVAHFFDCPLEPLVNAHGNETEKVHVALFWTMVE